MKHLVKEVGFTARLNVKPIQMELSNFKECLRTATRGYKLLKNKQDELMRRLADFIRKNNELRKEIEAALVDYMQDFAMAKSLENALMVEEVSSILTKEAQLSIEAENVMSVIVPKMRSHIEGPYGDDNGDVVYSHLVSSSEMDDILVTIEGLTEKLPRLAEAEKSCQLMANEIEKARHRTNGLEYSTIPQLEEAIHYIELKLEKIERVNPVCTMKVK